MPEDIELVIFPMTAFEIWLQISNCEDKQELLISDVTWHVGVLKLFTKLQLRLLPNVSDNVPNMSPQAYPSRCMAYCKRTIHE